MKEKKREGGKATHAIKKKKTNAQQEIFDWKLIFFNIKTKMFTTLDIIMEDNMDFIALRLLLNMPKEIGMEP